jgi:hypothetical protein
VQDRPRPAATGFQLAAHASYMMPVLALAEGMILGAIRGHASESSALLITFINVTIICVGVVFAVSALLGIPRHGTRHILAPALVGLVLNLLLLAMFRATWNNWRRGASTRGTAARPTMIEHASGRETWYVNPPRNAAA